MKLDKKTSTSIIQLDNGSNYEVIESIAFIEMLMTDDFIDDNSFITFHFPDCFECKLKKSRISAFYENSD